MHTENKVKTIEHYSTMQCQYNAYFTQISCNEASFRPNVGKSSTCRYITSTSDAIIVREEHKKELFLPQKRTRICETHIR